MRDLEADGAKTSRTNFSFASDYDFFKEHSGTVIAGYSKTRPATVGGGRVTEGKSVQDLPKLAFDHDRIIDMGLARLKGKVLYQPIGFELLPAKFTLSELQRLYETILERPLDKRNFRKKVLQLGVLDETDEVQEDVAHRAARLYRFNRKRYAQLVKRGFNFEI